MTSDDIVYVKDLKVGDLLHWGTDSYRGLYFLLSIEVFDGKFYPQFFDVKRARIYDHDIEEDSYFEFCVKIC